MGGGQGKIDRETGRMREREGEGEIEREVERERELGERRWGREQKYDR